GIHTAIKMSHIAEAGHIPCMLGCMSETKLGITAAAHVALSSHAFEYFDLDSHLEHAENPILGGIDMTGGIITLPEEPGIGAYPDPDCVAQLEETT
ncbi:MAG: dipeptide epimerase, partial [Planctomycetes bacterium]|nr:dipeptide epimerase [Planctomycetota bacterium]